MAARGVAIFIKTGLFDNISIIHKSTSQNVIILKGTRDTNEIFLIGLYLESSKEDISEIYNYVPIGANIILGGDLNTVLDKNPDCALNLDLKNRSSIPNPQVHNEIVNLINRYNLIDTFRQINGSRRCYSFSKTTNGRTAGSRLDHILVSKPISFLVSDAEYVLTNKFFDHKCLCVTLGKHKVKTKNSILRYLYNTKTFIRIIKSAHIAALMEVSGLSSNIDPIFKDFFETSQKIKHLESHLLYESDHWLKYVLDNTYCVLENYYTLTKDLIAEYLPPSIDSGEVLANFCMKITNDCLASSNAIKKAKNAKRNFLINKIAEFNNEPALKDRYTEELELYEMTKCHNLNSVGTMEDDFSETDNLGRIAKALNNPNKITLEALGTEENRKEKLFNHFKKFFDVDPEFQKNNPTLDHFMSGIDPLLFKASLSQTNS